METETIQYESLGLCVVVENPQSEDYSIGYKIYLTDDINSNSQDKTTLILRGFVRWDGCSNWETNDDVMLHGCSRHDVTRIGEIMGICWDLTAKYCIHWIAS